MGPTETLADYIVKSKLSDFPDEVVLQAKHCTQDVIGCALGGAQMEIAQRYIGVAKELGGRPDSTIIGDGAKTSCVYAAHTNTELGNMLDFDDIHWLTLTHPGSPIVCSALATGELVNASGEDILTAVIVGYEVGLRIGRSMRSIVALPDGKKEVMSNPSYIVFASIAAASKILGLKAEEINNAFGLAGSTPINRGQSRVHLFTPTPPYTENKYDMGIYSLIGVFSTFRGRRIAGPKNILDGDHFWSRCGANTCDHAELTKELGKEHRIMEMAFKSASSCGCTEAPVSAIREALKGERFSPQEIESIKLVGLPRLLYYQWDTMVQAEFSTPCAVALAVAGEESGPDSYASGRYKDSDILEIASKVTFDEDPKARELALARGQWVCTAEIKTKDGKVRKAYVDFEKGAPENPFSEDELHHKFVVNSRGTLGEKQAEELWDALLHLEKTEKISTLATLLARA